MYKLNASAFYEAVVVLQQTIAFVEKDRASASKVMGPGARPATIAQLEKLKEHVDTLRCHVSSMAAADLIGHLTNDITMTYHDYGTLALNLRNTFKNELTLQTVFVMDPKRSDFYEPKISLFGNVVATQFPSLAPEISEIGRCYACDRTTASAFHSLRCLEAGIRAVRLCLGIPDPIKGYQRNWSKVSEAIKTEIDKRWPASTGRMSGDAQLFDEIFGAFAGLQNPYRNATMHLEATYNAEDAYALYVLVRGLMTRIAARMNEEGLPLLPKVP
jgi:hypothetical protein